MISWTKTKRLSTHDHASDPASFRRNRRIVVSLGGLAALVFLALLIGLKTPNPYAVIELRTTHLHQIVDRAFAAQFALNNLIRLDGTSACRPLLNQMETGQSVTVLPASGTAIIYRWRADALSIRLTGPGPSEPAGRLLIDSRTCILDDRATFVVDVSASGTGLILPLAGPVSAGSETIGANQTVGHFYGGTITLYGRALLPPHRGTLYPASNAPLLLAEGGRVTASLDLKAGDSWYGTVRTVADGMVISATADTDLITIVRPGSTGEIEPLGVGLLAQLFNDPSVAPWTIGLLFITSAVHMGIALTAMLPPVAQPGSTNGPEIETPDDSTAEDIHDDQTPKMDSITDESPKHSNDKPPVA